MIFKDILKRDGFLLREEFRRLLNLARDKQFHPCDLLVLNENGFYDPGVLLFRASDGTTLNPHVIGPGPMGYAEITQYEFIHRYRTTNYSELSSTDYSASFLMSEFNRELHEANEHRIHEEAISIQTEMMIYLKIWESDFFIRKMYQLVRLLHGEPYDWYFKIQESPRDKEFTGNRQEIIRKMIRDRLKDVSPVLYDVISRCYKTQIRNSIAHSNFSFLGRNIHLNNFIEGDSASQSKTLSFDEWINIFHGTLLLWGEYVGIYSDVNEYYKSIVSKQNNEIPILVTEKSGRQYELPVLYRPLSNSWGYKQA